MPDELSEVFRREAGRCTATLIRVLGDIDLAEDAVAEAFVIASEQWPIHGMPPNPGGWITTTARNRAIDKLRRESSRKNRYQQAALMHERDDDPSNRPMSRYDYDEESEVSDDRLRLIFTCCHVSLAPATQIALTLRLL